MSFEYGESRRARRDQWEISVFWLHGSDCWESDESWLDVDSDPYCSWDIDRRLEDDESAVPSKCGGRWVRLEWAKQQ